MREIKFRGKCKVSGEWVYGVPIPNSFGDRVFMIPLLLADKIAYPFERLVDWVVEVWPETIGESTGLKDKKDVAIFEGDIVRVINEYGRAEVSDVIWGLTDSRYGNYPAFSMPEIETELNSFAEVFDSGDYEIEVIGNIYENSDLLEVNHGE